MRATAAAYNNIFFRFFSVSIHFSQVAPASPDIKCKQSFLAAGLYDLTDADEKPNRFEEPPGRVVHVKRRIKRSQLNEEENESNPNNSITIVVSIAHIWKRIEHDYTVHLTIGQHQK